MSLPYSNRNVATAYNESRTDNSLSLEPLISLAERSGKGYGDENVWKIKGEMTSA